MNPNDPTLRVEARFKNARLYNAIREHSVLLSPFANGQAVQRTGPVKPFCEAHEFPLLSVYDLLNLKRGPMRRWRDKAPTLRPLCQRLASVLEREPEWLFPAALYAITWPILAFEGEAEPFMRQLSSVPRDLLLVPPQHEDAFMLRDAVAGALQRLPPREQAVLTSKYLNDETLNEIGCRLGVSRERVRQLEARAMRRLRKSRALRDYA